MLDLLCRVWSAELWICPSPLISRCSPGLAAYKCLNRTTCPQSLVMWGPWSDRGIQTTPTEKKVLARDTMTKKSSMICQIRCKLSVAAPSGWPYEGSLILTQPFQCVPYQLLITPFPKSNSQKQTTTHPCTTSNWIIALCWAQMSTNLSPCCGFKHFIQNSGNSSWC